MKISRRSIALLILAAFIGMGTSAIAGECCGGSKDKKKTECSSKKSDTSCSKKKKCTKCKKGEMCKKCMEAKKCKKWKKASE